MFSVKISYGVLFNFYILHYNGCESSIYASPYCTLRELIIIISEFTKYVE